MLHLWLPVPETALLKRTHIWAGILLAALSAFCLLWVIPENTAPAQSDLDLSPALMPSVAVGLCLVLSLVMLVHALRAGVSEAADLDEEFGEEASGTDLQVLGNLLIWAVVSVVSLLIMEHVGFEPAMTVFLASAMLFVGARNPWSIGLIAVLAPIGLSQLVFHVFTTELPAIWR